MGMVIDALNKLEGGVVFGSFKRRNGFLVPTPMWSE